MNPLVSIIVTTKNEEDNLDSCLRSIAEQTYSNIEIIVIDNNSTDKTTESASKYTNLVFNKGPERSAQRNEGMLKIAQGHFCAYFDADMLLSKYLVEDAVKQFKNTEAVALYIPEFILGNQLFARIRRFERQFYNGTAVDAARIFKRYSLLQVKGFDEETFRSGSGEDWDLDKSIRLVGKVELLGCDYAISEQRHENTWLLDFASYRGFTIPNSFNGILHNESSDRLLPYLRKKKYYATGFEGYQKKWGAQDEDIRKQLGVKYRLFMVFVEDKKWKIVLRNPHLFVGVIFLKVLIGIFTFRQLKVKND